MVGFWGFLKVLVNEFCYNREIWLIGIFICWLSYGNYFEWF